LAVSATHPQPPPIKNYILIMDNQEEFKEVQYRMNDEGFHYCFKNYSDFEEIEDKRFHKLRLAYLGAAKELEDYINQKAEE